jgi:carbohydrate-binding DOMON domain-containing protein
MYTYTRTPAHSYVHNTHTYTLTTHTHTHTHTHAHTDLGGKASAMSASVAGYSLVAIGGVAAVYLARSFLQVLPSF